MHRVGVVDKLSGAAARQVPTLTLTRLSALPVAHAHAHAFNTAARASRKLGKGAALRTFAVSASPSPSASSSSRSSTGRVWMYALLGVVGVSAAGVVLGSSTLACESSDKLQDKDKGHSSRGGWSSLLGPGLQPSKRSHSANAANVGPVNDSSVEGALGSIDEHAGEVVANRGVGVRILNLAQSATEQAIQLARDERSNLPVEEAILVKAPNVPPPLTRQHPVLLKVALKTTAKIMQLTNRLKYEFWTFNDLVPGPMIRARVGDVVELSLTNEDYTGNPHNIDCHGFEGPGGGAPITTAQLGETKVARFKMLYPGLYVYHCAAAPVPAHVMNGMYGLMLVEPEYTTLPRVDKEYYVMQSEFYHEPLDPSNGNRVVEPSYPKGLDENADVVVFNGHESALTTESPLQAKTGEHVRIYFGNAGPNLISSFHVIGGIFEKVWRDGDLVSPPARFLQTVLVPPGGASVMDLHPVVPGTYTLVDHAIFRLDKGAVGYMNVTGKERPDLYAGGDPQPCPGCKLHP